MKIFLHYFTNVKLVVFLGVSLVFSFFFYKYLSLSFLITKIDLLADFINSYGIMSVIIYFMIYTIFVMFSVPSATILTFAAGYLYGPFTGGVLAYCSALFGATLLFMLVQTGLKAKPSRRVMQHPAFSDVDFGISNNPFRYILILRLLPIFPFWMVNLAPAILGVRLKAYFVASALGILPGTFLMAIIGAKVRFLSPYNLNIVGELKSDPIFILSMLGLSVLILFPTLLRIKRRIL